MKNRSNRDGMESEMDPELAKKIEGLTPSQIDLMASVYAGMAEQLREKKIRKSLAKWRPRKDYSRN